MYKDQLLTLFDLKIEEDIDLCIEDFGKYMKMNHFAATKLIIKEYNLGLKEDSRIFDALLFRVRQKQNMGDLIERQYLMLSSLTGQFIKSKPTTTTTTTIWGRSILI